MLLLTAGREESNMQSGVFVCVSDCGYVGSAAGCTSESGGAMLWWPAWLVEC